MLLSAVKCSSESGRAENIRVLILASSVDLTLAKSHLCGSLAKNDSTFDSIPPCSRANSKVEGTKCTSR